MKGGLSDSFKSVLSICTDYFSCPKIKDRISTADPSKQFKGQRSNLNDIERIKYFLSNFEGEEFARRDYIEIFKEISLPTASRDMKKGIEMKFWKKTI